MSYLNFSKLPVLKPRIRKSDKTKKQVSFIWFITLTVSKGVYECFLPNSCLNFVMRTCFAFNQIIYENAADTRIC